MTRAGSTRLATAVLGSVAAAGLVGCTAAAEPAAEPTAASAPTPTPTLTVLAPGELQPLAPGTYALNVLPSEPDELPRPVIEIGSDGFSGDGVFVMAGDGSAFHSIGVLVLAEVAGNPCDRTSGPFADPGPTVADLANALAAQPLTDVTEPVAVNVGGYDGLYLELSIPDDIDVSACDDDVYSNFLLEEEIRTEGSPGTVSWMWILDVDGHRLVVNATHDPGTTPQQIAELGRMAESLTFIETATQ